MLEPKQTHHHITRVLIPSLLCFLLLTTQTGCWALWLAKQIDQCPNGSEGCPCSESDACVNDLVCIAGTCEPPSAVPEPVEEEIPMITSASCQGLPIEDWRSRGGTFSGALHDPAAFQEPAQTCSPSWLDSGLAQAYHLDAQDSRYAGGPVLAIEFEGGAPISLNGMACVPLPNQGYDKIITSSFCERRYLCGCCGIAIAPRAESADAGSDVEQFDFLVKAWSAEDLPARQCQGIEKQGRYLLDTPTPFAATAKTDEGVASQSCQDCLDGCRAEASEGGDGALVATCCTGAGCVCQSACAISSCPDNSSHCCGQDGHCFCSEDTSAFQCPW